MSRATSATRVVFDHLDATPDDITVTLKHPEPPGREADLDSSDFRVEGNTVVIPAESINKYADLYGGGGRECSFRVRANCESRPDTREFWRLPTP